MTANRRMTVTVAFACALSSTALYPLFTGSAWFYAGLGAIITVAASGALSRLRTLPVAVGLAISVAGLLLYLNLVFEVRHSLGAGHTHAGLAEQAVGAGGHRDHRRRPGILRPAPELPRLVLLAVGGIGITAILTDLIAVRLRSTALAGLPLLVLFTVPITVNAQAREHRHPGGVLPGHGGIPGHAERRRPGADPGVGQAGLAVAVRSAV